MHTATIRCIDTMVPGVAPPISLMQIYGIALTASDMHFYGQMFMTICATTKNIEL